MISETNTKEATKKLKYIKILNHYEYEVLKKLLKGEQHANQMDYKLIVKKHLKTKIMIHQVTDVTDLGWKPATETRLGHLS